MPKTPSVILKNMLAQTQYELLDIYRFKDHDLVRVKNTSTNKVYLVRLEKHVNDLVSEEDFKKTVEQILSEVRKLEEEEKKKQQKQS